MSVLIAALKKWRVVHLLGVSALRARYARSYLGQFWLTVCALAQIVVIGVVWAKIWRQPIDFFIAYYGVGFSIYSFVSSSIFESAGVIAGDARYYVNDKLPFMVSVLAHIYRNFLVILHNIPIVVGLIIWSEAARFTPTWSMLPAAPLALLFITFAAYVVSVLCTRYRDLGQIVGIVGTNLFILTPIMWESTVLAPEIRGYVYVNPLAALVELFRNPLIGLPVSPLAWYSLGAWTVAAGLAGGVMQRIFGRKLIFWI